MGVFRRIRILVMNRIIDKVRVFRKRALSLWIGLFLVWLYTGCSSKEGYDSGVGCGKDRVCEETPTDNVSDNFDAGYKDVKTGQPDDSSDAIQPKVSQRDDAADALQNATCRPDDEYGRAFDDAGVDEERVNFFNRARSTSDNVTISGIISDDGNCVSGVEVCLLFRVQYDIVAYTVETDQNGTFTLVTGRPSEFITITPRKAGYEFDPPSFVDLTDSSFESDNAEVRFTAHKKEIPEHATGQWKVTRDSCDEIRKSCSETDDKAIGCQNLHILCDGPGGVGSVFGFSEGCLFGGINCVSGFQYSENNALCEGYQYTCGMFITCYRRYREGTYDESAGKWYISEMTQSDLANFERTLELERVLE